MHKLTSILLILFAGGSLVRGIHEFTEIGILPGIREITLPLIPSSTTVIGDLFKTVFGITQQMSLLQSSVYILYVGFMIRKISSKTPKVDFK